MREKKKKKIRNAVARNMYIKTFTCLSKLHGSLTRLLLITNYRQVE